MKKYLSLALVSLLWGNSLQGDYYDQPRCLDVCAYTEVNNYYRFVSIENTTSIYLKCRIQATNGADHIFYLRPMTQSRLFTINDPSAAWSWNCNEYRN